MDDDTVSSRHFCKNCGATSIIVDPSSSARVCTSCGCEQSYDNFQFHFSADEPQGTFIHVGDFDYRQRKSYNARNQIADSAASLGLSASRIADITAMIEKITEGEFGAGRWFSVLIAACAHVVTREHGVPLSLTEIAAATGHDVHEIGRMVTRVREFLDVRLPVFDVLAALDRAVRTCGCLASLPAEKLEEMARQGRFVLQCCVKWYLTTGRQPLPVVAAVLAFVAEVNGAGLTLEDVARDVCAKVATSRLRQKELKETLVKVARAALPWGKDVTVKNLARSAPSLLQYMARKSKEKRLNSEPEPEPALLDLGEVASECTRKEFEYTADGYVAKKDSVYFDVEERREGARCEDLEKLKLPDCLQRAYRDVETGFEAFKSRCGEIEAELGRGRKRTRSEGLEYNDVWVGELDSNTRLSLEEMVKTNVGFDAFPPSFVAGEEACKRRREKINAAKVRIGEIMKPTAGGSDEKRILSNQLRARKECERRVWELGIDWEDCTVELLLLHGVKEDEIEQGNYKRLLELYVFC
ncbi:hypothetical protein ACLOJK_008836 [Asimina triloba]